MASARTYLFCLGATKAGTSWLHDQLAAHPGCRLRTIKEYHYFTKRRPADFDAAIAANADEAARLRRRMAGRDDGRNAWARAHLADLADYDRLLAARAPDADGFRTLLDGAPGDGAVAGDFTPAYALMAGRDLRALAAFAPDTRAIYILRDPLARLWSHVRMVAARLAPNALAETARGLLAQVCEGAPATEPTAIAARGDYAVIVPKVARAFDPARLLVIFYEEMMTAPGFARLCAFLGIEVREADFARRVHAGAALAMTPEDRRRALRFLRPQYEFAATRFPALPDAWRSAMSEAL